MVDGDFHKFKPLRQRIGLIERYSFATLIACRTEGP